MRHVGCDGTVCLTNFMDGDSVFTCCGRGLWGSHAAVDRYAAAGAREHGPGWPALAHGHVAVVVDDPVDCLWCLAGTRREEYP